MATILAEVKSRKLGTLREEKVSFHGGAELRTGIGAVTGNGSEGGGVTNNPSAR
jgi:hypothetical protein